MRLDRALVERELADSRDRAQGLILAGAVRVDGTVTLKAAVDVSDSAEVTVDRPGDELASRGGHKLEAALDRFSVAIAEHIAVDVGASTGGFTDVLLRRGAERVYAVDVGYGQLAWRLRSDPRVVVMERTNFRNLESLPEAPGIATVDVSFISLRLILPVLRRLLSPSAQAVVLIKPQFEVGRGRVGKGGVVRDPALHRSALTDVLEAARADNWSILGVMPSPLIGPAGNREFLAHISLKPEPSIDLDAGINLAVGGELGSSTEVPIIGD
jgi:23S rRNA (cytidine1920-2'-O)/16S rRNA (cytidine1409-2'-O)-methyltransferase